MCIVGIKQKNKCILISYIYVHEYKYCARIDPESLLFQLRGGTFTPCTEFSVSSTHINVEHLFILMRKLESISLMQPSMESAIASLIWSNLVLVIRDGCQCDFQESFISPAMILCQEEEPSRVVYRSNITRYGLYSANQLVQYIEEWVKQGALISSGVFVVKFDPKCSVRVFDANEPVCGSEFLLSFDAVTLFLDASLTASFVITTMIIAISIVVVCCIMKKKTMYDHCTDDLFVELYPCSKCYVTFYAVGGSLQQPCK